MFTLILYVLGPGFAPFGDGGLIPCDTDCGFNDLINGINGLIQFIIYLAVPLATVSFAYAGFLYMTASGDTGKLAQAHKIFRIVVVGLILMFSAWLIVHTITGALLKEPEKYYNIEKQ
ncbi:MAG: pilin [Patescibacteria group bacterium]|nr:pilin [Patescibacteria group bacterium]